MFNVDLKLTIVKCVKKKLFKKRFARELVFFFKKNFELKKEYEDFAGKKCVSK